MITLTWKWNRSGGIAELRCGYCGSDTMPTLIKRTSGSIWKDYTTHTKHHAGHNGPGMKSDELLKQEAITRARSAVRQTTRSAATDIRQIRTAATSRATQAGPPPF